MGAILVPLNKMCRKCSSNLRLKDVINGEEGPYPVYGASGIVGYSNSYQIDQEYVAVVKDGAGVGRVLKCEANSSVLGTLQPIIPTNSVNRDYLFSVLETLDLAKHTSGSTIPHIYFKDYGKEPIPYLDRAEQNLLASRFRTINRALGACNSLIERFDLLVKSRFIEMFGHNEDSVRLSTVCTLYNGDRGKNYPSGKDRVEEGVPFVNAGDLVDGRISFEKMGYITEERYKLLSGGKIERGDILYCLRGTLGKCAIADFSGGTIASSMMIIRPNQNKVLPAYLYQVLASPLVEKQLQSARNGSTQPNLSAKSVGNYVIPLPHINRQREFTDFVAWIDKLRFDVQQQIEKLETLKKSLMQEYFG